MQAAGICSYLILYARLGEAGGRQQLLVFLHCLIVQADSSAAQRWRRHTGGYAAHWCMPAARGGQKGGHVRMALHACEGRRPDQAMLHAMKATTGSLTA